MPGNCSTIVDPADNIGHTPLHYACQEGYSEPVQLLLDRGAYEFRPSNRGESPMERFEWGVLVAQMRNSDGHLRRLERAQAKFELARSELELNRSLRMASLSVRRVRVAQERKDEAARREDADAATTTTQSPTVQPLDVDAAN